MEKVNGSDKEIKITSDGQSLEIISPISEEKQRQGFGLAQGTITIKSDIVEPVITANDWQALISS